MAAASEGSPPQRPPTPRSPPRYPDLCGRRRLQLEVQILNREIGFVEDELKSLEGLQSIARCCKEVSEFVGTNPDPLIPLNKRRHKTCHIWKWLRKMLCFCLPCICCGNPCLLQLKRSSCTCLHLKNCCHCKFGCPRSNCCALSCWKPCYLNCTGCWPHSCCKASCCRPQCTKCAKSCSCCNVSHCIPSKLSCPEFSCGCVWSCPECTVVRLCPKCCKPCCGVGYLC